MFESPLYPKGLTCLCVDYGESSNLLVLRRGDRTLLWYLSEALALQPTGLLHTELSLALTETERLTYLSAEALAALDVEAHRQDVNALLLRTSELVRAAVRRETKELRGADLIGAKLAGADLRGASLRGGSSSEPICGAPT